MKKILETIVKDITQEELAKFAQKVKNISPLDLESIYFSDKSYNTKTQKCKKNRKKRG